MLSARKRSRRHRDTIANTNDTGMARIRGVIANAKAAQPLKPLVSMNFSARNPRRKQTGTANTGSANANRFNNGRRRGGGTGGDAGATGIARVTGNMGARVTGGCGGWGTTVCRDCLRFQYRAHSQPATTTPANTNSNQGNSNKSSPPNPANGNNPMASGTQNRFCRDRCSATNETTAVANAIGPPTKNATIVPYPSKSCCRKSVFAATIVITVAIPAGNSTASTFNTGMNVAPAAGWWRVL